MVKQILFFLSLFFIVACGDEKEPEKKIVKEPTKGELIVKQNCKVCHAQGLNGAPIIGNKKMWGPRLVQGEKTLVTHAINGYELMPAKGGNTELTDDEIALAVKYFISKVE